MRRGVSLAVVTAVIAMGGHIARAQGGIEPFAGSVHGVEIDSGPVRNAGPEERVVYTTTITVPGASWLRLSFDNVQLAGQTPEDSSFLRVTSMHDGHQQSLDRAGLRQWSMTSAYFNGDTVVLDLIASPGTGENRVAVPSVMAGPPFPIGGTDTVCGQFDDRTLSADPRVARLAPQGCTAWIFDDPAHTFLTAGHCLLEHWTDTVVEFNVPLSTPEGIVQHPPPSDQYSVDPDSIQSTGDTPAGDDYAYFGCFPNTETGLTPYEAQGDYHVLATTIIDPSAGQGATVTGYGIIGFPLPLSWNQAQTSHTGLFIAIDGTLLHHTSDTTGGNSGGPVIDENTGQAIAIHTHGGCQDIEATNRGTIITHPGLHAFLDNPQGVCVPQTLRFSFPDGLPTLIPPQGVGAIPMHVLPNAGTEPMAGTAQFHYNAGGGWNTLPLTATGENEYTVSIPPTMCGRIMKYYFTAQDTATNLHADPPTAPAKFYAAPIGTGIEETSLLSTSFENGFPAGWYTLGLWNVTSECGFGTPCDGTSSFAYYGDTNTCTYDTPGFGNFGRIRTPPIDLSRVPADAMVTLRYCSRLKTEDMSGFDIAQVLVNGKVMDEPDESTLWEERTVHLDEFAGGFVVIEFWFTTVDRTFNQFLGWQVDNVSVTAQLAVCDNFCPPDCDGSSSLDLFDVLCFLNEFNEGKMTADCDESGSLDLFDVLCYLNDFVTGCP